MKTRNGEIMNNNINRIRRLFSKRRRKGHQPLMGIRVGSMIDNLNTSFNVREEGLGYVFKAELGRLKAEYDDAKKAYDRSPTPKNLDKLKKCLRRWHETKKLSKIEHVIGIASEKEIALRGMAILKGAMDELDRAFEAHGVPVEPIDLSEDMPFCIKQMEELGEDEYIRQMERKAQEFRDMLYCIKAVQSKRAKR